MNLGNNELDYYCRYFARMLMALMRGPQTEEVVVEVKEEEKLGPLRVLPALPHSKEESPAPPAPIHGQLAIAHDGEAGARPDSIQPGSGEDPGQAEADGEHRMSTTENPEEVAMTLADLLG